MLKGGADEFEGSVKPFLETVGHKHGVALHMGLDAHDDMIRALRNEGVNDEIIGFLHDPLLTFLRESESRSLIDQLIAATRLYDNSEAVKALMDFVVRLRRFAPFNAMLLHTQKPGLTHAASARDWQDRFGRHPKIGARPLIIMRPKGPVDFVFDVQDTEGKELPVDAFSFPTFGVMTVLEFQQILDCVGKEAVELVKLDAGDGSAGWISSLGPGKSATSKRRYRLARNTNHSIPTQVVTIAHELAHLYLGHLGADKGRDVPDRTGTDVPLREVEAEMAAYLVAKRNGLTPRSETYLETYKEAFARLELYHVMRATNAVETAMGVSAQRLWNGASGAAPTGRM